MSGIPILFIVFMFSLGITMLSIKSVIPDFKRQPEAGCSDVSPDIHPSVSVFEGNTGDPTTLMPQVDKMRDEFGINEFVLVGDRGMLTQKQIDILKGLDGIDWIGALRPEAKKK